MSNVERFYARQSRLIDGGDAAGWAATFTPDGVFDSPSYPQPSRGTEELEAFARAFFASCVADGVQRRHVVTSVDVVGDDGPLGDAEVTAHAYLQIVATPAGQDSRLVRLTTITDRLVRTPDVAGGAGWRVAHRAVRRDDVAPQHPTREGASA